MSTVLQQWRYMLALLILSSCLEVETKVFERCELAKVLRQRHRLDLTEVAHWVCIAQHSSGFNTAAQAFSSSGGSHGLFQVSDVYWCSPPGQGAGCNIPCHKLKDDNLSDDLSCIKKIYSEHQRISGDGYTAWNAYQQFCKNNVISYIQDCFPGEQVLSSNPKANKGYSYHGQFGGNAIQDYAPKKSGKVYGRCELARELYQKHKMPMEQIPTWVCIAEHESRFNTAAVGRLNADGSADHGLFQISDLYWCSHDRFSGGKACGLSCNKLLDDDITDDVRCIKRIHNEHTVISGDGFNAWTVYKPYCQNQRYDHIANCFKNTQHKPQYTTAVTSASNQVYSTNKFGISSSNPFLINVIPQTITKTHKTPSYSTQPSRGVSHKGKVYTRCSLAQELYFKHNFPMQDISTWVCIAEHESQFNTAAIGRLNTDGSADHGLFQISDRYWCDHSAYGGKACNLACDKLLDDDLRDDVACIKTIHEEHTRLSGDGFNAWTVYRPHCQNQNIQHIRTCFDDETLQAVEEVQPAPTYNMEVSKGKIYTKCELAQELYHKHRMPMEQIPKWVCIAQHESSFNTAAVGRLNADGSADHGLFQISDLYWCSHDQYGGKACNIPCHKLLDSDITDDVRCIKIIHEEHTRISGDGFNAWTVYKPHCRNTGMDHIKQCFTEKELKEVSGKPDFTSSNALIPSGSKSVAKGKIYKKCELAQELYRKHQMPMDQIPKWVCIAQHESSYNTAAVGRLNADGSADHGLFQISDLYWCSHDRYGGKACNIPCDKLLDSDITDDVRCIKIIHEEHTRISGDGFNAWTVYKPHCRNIAINHVQECFTDKELKEVRTGSSSSNALVPQTSFSTKPAAGKGKIYKKCELAQELYHKHHMPMEQIPKWVCIAQHESSYNTAAVGRLNTDGSADHGLFQISDLYWCSHDQYGGKACNIPCDKLLDSDITDDVRCIKIIHEEHTRISGDGFNAWTVYKPHCRNVAINHVQECFTDKELKEIKSDTSNALIPQTSFSTKPAAKGKIYKKCELAQELYHKHHMPMEQIPKWVCIAQHESSYNTAAVGRLNTDGSADHGLFQISDLYWCTHDQYGGKACNIPCDKLLDSDITDDVRCIKIIHEEHTRISGDGFNAWTVYKPHCRNTGMHHIKECFTEQELQQANVYSTSVATNAIQPQYTPDTKTVAKGKIYKKCELAQELLSKHKMPMEQIPTWVCIAQHESSFNTAAVGRLNADGSADHGLFQISDLYWCSHDAYGGKACNIPCDKLLDSDITDDVRCIKIIHEEHTRISGDGFNAWTVYKPHCRNRKMEEIRSCFSPNQIEEYEKSQKYTNKVSYTQTLQQQPNSHNPFLNGGLKPQSSQNVQKISYKEDFKFSTPNERPNYANNPFLQNLQIGSGTQVQKATTLFLSGAFNTIQPTTTTKPNYKDNPFLNGAFSSLSNKNIVSETKDKDSFKTNPFLSNIKLTTTTKPTSEVYKTEVTKHYLNSNDFRTTTTAKPRITTAAKPITTTKKPTTSWTTTKPTTSWTTTKSPKTTTTWSWQNQKYQNPTTTTTKKPLSTTKSTTTWSWQNQKSDKSTAKTPKSTTSWSWQNPTTTSRTTTKSPKTTTTWSWQNQKYQNPSTTTTKKPATTTKSSKSTTTWNWQNQKYANATTTAAPRTTTTWNWQNQKYQNPTTTKSSKTTTSWNWQKQQYLTSTTTKSPITTKSWNQRYINNATLAQTTTTSKPEKTTWNWRNEQKSTTIKPLTTTVNWRKWDKTTRTTTKPTTTVTTTTTTRKPTQKTTTSWKSLTTKSTTTKRPYYNDNLKTTTTFRPRTTTTTATSTTKTLTTKSSKINDNKKDPFSHPFFAKVNQEIEQLRKHVSTTKLPTFAATKLQSFPQSKLYEDFKNNTLNKTKTIVAYNFENSKLNTTKRPR